MRIVYMGTPDFAVPALLKLYNKGHAIVGVYTRPPQPSGRNMELKPSVVHQAALDLDLPVFTPKNLKSPAEQEAFASLKPDCAIVAAYGLLLPRAILDAPKFGCLNIHPSLLPRWRGAAPIQRALMAGDVESGVMVMKMDEGLDTGPVCLMERAALSADATAGQWHDQAREIGANLILQALELLEKDDLRFSPQAKLGVAYARKIEKADARINWTQPASALHNLVRGLSPFPAAWFEVSLRGKVERIKIRKSRVVAGDFGPPGTLAPGEIVACGENGLQLLEAQRSGKAIMPFSELARGVRLEIGDSLS